MNNPMMENVNRKQVTENLDSTHGDEVLGILSKLNEAN